MSGQLVGEVLAAADALRARGLSPRGFYALIAIAEKAETHSRRASVRWDHIRAALYGSQKDEDGQLRPVSPSTAKRAVADLKSAGLIRVVKRGFDNQNGRVCAPIYEVRPLDSKQTEQVTQVTQSVDSEQVTQVTQSTGTERVKSGGRTGQIDDRTGHLGDLLDVPIDVPLDGSAREIPDPPAPETPH
ncbi:hypothetical protein, partial [Mycolicibacterium wolinskyi]|uniref:hypothetical protein n=2 Tax=Mycobacteriaceae TaxID=1762 RepID=UPI00105602F2